MVSYQPETNGPDIVIKISGKPGSGKSCLMGDLVAMLELYGCEVRCFKQRRNSGDDHPMPKPAEGNFNEIRKIKIVEVN